MENRKRLQNINSLEDFKRIRGRDMPALAREIREFLIENVSRTGGHLASNLGVVELTLAIHKCFDSPRDHIIWDVGHQCYVHKLVTGRLKDFNTLRTPGGLSGFTKRSESVHDCFGAGHSSTSLSAGLGFAMSDACLGIDAYTVVVLGDGAFTGGMIHEAINNCRKDLRLIIILNENEMSISRNKGGFARYMSRIRTSGRYFKLKDSTTEFLERIPVVGKGAVELIRGTKQTLKNVIYSSNYFEEMGLYYMGPIDGNDYNAVANMIELAKTTNQSCIIHVHTKKGKGYPKAEAIPQKYHMVPKGGVHAEEGNSFSCMMGKYLVNEAKKNKDVCAITAAMPYGTGLYFFKKTFPDRFFDVGIAEEHAVTFAAGLAANGMKPFFAVYSSFLQRAYDNVIHDIALQNLPVTLCVDRTGLNEGDGATHHGIFDVPFLSSVPNMEIYAPITYKMLKKSIDDACSRGKPCAVRYPRGDENSEVARVFPGSEYVSSDIGDCKPEVVIVTYGDIVTEALRAEKLFDCKTLLLQKLKPYDETAENIAVMLPDSVKSVIFLEEGIKNGGAGMCLFERLREILPGKCYMICGIDDDFVLGDKGKSMRQSAGITAEDILIKYSKAIEKS